ncbi:MAG: bifunctional 3-deoxy-7-phosphoheptulonate synthase/chorismate mutase type II [Flavobacteriaceae bacterium]|nr:bifunctional 3-deoxy-7-phosphoheptulonate synthase/chorismate mutase type II [Flavobacteriaceae bacterium]
MINSDESWFGQFSKPLIIAGPCSAETEKQMLITAEGIAEIKVDFFRAGIWKPRTKPNSFEGVGAQGLKWLQRVKDDFGLKTATEVATAEHARLALEHDVDLLWIGARTTVNPFQVQEIAEALQDTDKIVMVKNPVNPDLDLWMGAFERMAGQGIKKLAAIHRGFSIYKKIRFRNEPQWQIPLDFKKEFPLIPLICDPSHITGNRNWIDEVAQEAMNFGFDGLMVETHPNPNAAWSDAEQQVTPEQLKNILQNLILRDADDIDKEYQMLLSSLRHQIDEIDRNMLEMLANRMKVAEEIGALKKSHNVALFQPDRWAIIKSLMLKNAYKYGLSQEFIERFLNAVHQESIQVQNKIMEQNQNSL